MDYIRSISWLGRVFDNENRRGTGDFFKCSCCNYMLSYLWFVDENAW